MLQEFMNKHDISIEELLDSIKVGVYVTDGEGNTLMLNNECCKTGGMLKEEVIGKNMQELLNIGYVKESDSFRVMESGREERFVQNLGDGGKLYITGVPVYKNGKIELIVSTERDVTEIIELKEMLQEQEEITEQYRSELEFLKQNKTEQEEIISVNPIMQKLLDYAVKIGKVDTTVLIQGESGTGKEIYADYIHKKSSRVEKPFIKINCAAIPDNLIESEFFGYERGAFTGAERNGRMGIFEATDGGTVFLDEIGDLPIQVQAKLLRVLQEKEIRRIGANESVKVDVRIIAATNINLKKAMNEGSFREDLYYRLNIASMEIPPLRNRKDDIEPLTLHFITLLNIKYEMKKSISKDALQTMSEYNWPGNVRELKNVIEKIMINYEGNSITRFQILCQIKEINQNSEEEKSLNLKELMENYEKDLLIYYFDKYKNGAEVAKLLKIDKATVSRKLRKYGIKV